uniref:Uncharacterized protein n=1 Tax=Chromera velia CCMP2878 TaxID=1169474 RepID=A0A0G4GPD1_9ALVE|eukprot:Cvel_4999.t1-p1 / transcript=Cvel_4999.t1 / gene=Cvel_4999 / organism=Chromera_velia_CCMP2878 / gene_product=Ankyrin-3, putative / transcript_product=Ankyrin-3, putative / location=Cvel_scaffold226:79077-87170(-) / protein_length=857 / sequence_SO=supercontig / SO=protein_coding / is_pseudo=false
MCPQTSDDITAEDVLRAMESVVKERFNSSTIEPHMFLLDDSLEIEIVAPDVPTLEIVDLPGWVQGNPELREQTRALILKHLDPNEDNLVLCVVSGQADSLRSSAILQLLSSEKCAHALPWTVGVITKADVIARPPLGRPSKLLEVLRDVKQGSSNYSSLPFIVPVVNRECSAQAPEELDRLTDLLPLWAKLENERLFFSQLCEDLTPLAQGPKETFNPNDMGLDGLLKQLMRLFRAYMKEKWAVRELKNMRAEREKTKQKLFSLGKDPKDIALPDLIRAAAAQLEKTVARMEPEIEKVVSGTEGGEGGETDGLSDWMIDLSAEGFDDTDSSAESSRLERARLRRYKHDRCEEALRDLPQTLARLAEKVIQTAFEDGSPHDESGLRLCRFENLKKSWLKAATTPEATALCVRKEKEAVDPPLQCARLKWTEWVDVVYEWFLLPTLGQTRERFNLEGGKTLLEENCAEERMALHARLDAIARGIRILKRLRDAPADGDDDGGEPARPSVAATHVDDSSDEEGGDFGDGLLEEFEVGGDEFPEPPGGAEEEEGEGEEEEEGEGTEGDDESLSSPTARLTTEEIRNVRRSTVGRQSLCLAEGEVLTEFLPSYEVVGEDGEEGCGDMNTPPAIAEGAGAAGTEGGQAGMDVQASRRQTEALRLEAMQVAPIRGTLEDLLDAARTGQRKSVKGLLAFGVDVNGKAGPDGRTALHMAAENNKRDVLTLLLLRGADVDVRDKFGMTPLHLAVRHGRKEICTILLEMNASVGAKSNGGCTPLHIAAQYNRKEICSLLLDHGAKVNCKDGLGYTPLHRAAQYGKKEMVSLLVERGAEVNTKDNIGWTPFRVATGEAAAILRARGGTH